MRVVRGGDMYFKNESEFSSLIPDEGVLKSVAFSSSVRTRVPMDSRYTLFSCRFTNTAPEASFAGPPQRLKKVIQF